MGASGLILGSVANMIVVESARGHCEVGFWDDARFGIPITLLTTLAGRLSSCPPRHGRHSGSGLLILGMDSRSSGSEQETVSLWQLMGSAILLLH